MSSSSAAALSGARFSTIWPAGGFDSAGKGGPDRRRHLARGRQCPQPKCDSEPVRVAEIQLGPVLPPGGGNRTPGWRAPMRRVVSGANRGAHGRIPPLGRPFSRNGNELRNRIGFGPEARSSAGGNQGAERRDDRSGRGACGSLFHGVRAGRRGPGKGRADFPRDPGRRTVPRTGRLARPNPARRHSGGHCCELRRILGRPNRPHGRTAPSGCVHGASIFRYGAHPRSGRRGRRTAADTRHRRGVLHAAGGRGAAGRGMGKGLPPMGAERSAGHFCKRVAAAGFGENGAGIDPLV